jgi:signal transduction histidine kinase
MDGTRIGTAFAATDRGDVSRIWAGFALLLVFAAGFVLIICVPAAILFTRHETAPLKEMANAARQFAKGDLSVRVNNIGRIDEVGELAEAFNQMADSLEKAEKSRMDFVANVSHELKTPMTTISGYADGLLDGTIPMDQAQQYLSIIANETKRLSRLVRQMLNISRMQDASVLRSGNFDVTETLRMAIIALDVKLSDKKLVLRPEIPEDALKVRGNEDAVSQVIYNILDNAVKFAQPGSFLDVRLFKQGPRAYLSIIDRGETIPPDELSSIFQRFHKSDRSRSLDRDGVGLGLYIVKSILDGMGEDIWVRSKDGETEFRFSLTLAE